MPLKATATSQNPTLTDAKAFITAIAAKGIPASDLREISGIDGQYISVNDPNYYDDGATHEFVANVWGKDVIVGLAEIQLGKGGFNNLMKLATTCFTLNGGYSPSATYLAAIQAIIALPGVADALDKLLAL